MTDILTKKQNIDAPITINRKSINKYITIIRKKLSEDENNIKMGLYN